jgi:hypothetical protein
MAEMSELSNAVTVLIARMESHPEDFAVGGKFTGVADALYGMLGLVQDIPRSSYWFLTDADKEALTEAWKKYHRTAMDKEIMEAIFDDGEGARELEKVQMELQRAKQRAMMQNSALQGSSYSYGQNAMNAAQGMAIHSGMANTLSLGKEVIDESLITKLKALIK